MDVRCLLILVSVTSLECGISKGLRKSPLKQLRLANVCKRNGPRQDPPK